MKANDILQVNHAAPKQSPFHYSNRDLLTKGIGQNMRGIARSDHAPVLLGHTSLDFKN